jgi:hypothetical protein
MPREGCERLGAERSGARERSEPCSSLTGVQRRTRPSNKKIPRQKRATQTKT